MREERMARKRTHPVQRAALYFGLVNLLIGIAGFAGPAVKSNRDRYINVNPGLLFGIFAMNWLHALVHLVAGALGLPARRTRSAARSYMAFAATLFGLLSAAGWQQGRARPGIYLVMGMALNTAANALHTLWALIGALFTLDPDLASTRRLLGAPREPELVVVEEEYVPVTVEGEPVPAAYP